MTERKLTLVYDNSPDALRNICLQYIVSKLELYTKRDEKRGYFIFNDSIILPRELSERLLWVYQKKHRVNDTIASLFRNRLQTPLEEVKLRNSNATINGLRHLLQHKPRKLELVQCDNLSDDWLYMIGRNCENLVSLKIGPFQYTSRLGPVNVQPQQCVLLNAPKLQMLTIHCNGSGMSPVLLDSPLCNLTHLELTNFDAAADPSCSIHELTNLRSLVLHNISWSLKVVEWIVGLRLLVHLDISQANERLGRYFNPNEVLASLIQNLTHLESLDISGTNLAGTGSAVPALTAGSADCGVKCDIPALMSRVNRPLNFLGLYGTHHGACKRHDIPAKVITGDANEDQILTAAEVYLERPAVLTRVLNDLYYIFRNTEKYSYYVGRTLAAVLDAMDTHNMEKNIQVSGSAILFYIVKGPEKVSMGVKLKKRIIITLLNSMESHSEDETLMRNGCLTLCQFQIPKDVLFAYERVVQLLLTGVTDVNQDGFVQRITIYLLNSLACHVDGKQKLLLGNHDAIEKMLNLISDRLERRICDDVLEVAWSTMWNVTDETPENCKRFLENRGMEYFLECLKHFPDKEELLRNMMGLLGNVAEVVELRPQLMDKLFLTVFYDLLDSSSDGIEVSYNAAGVLAHMASDGPEAWTVAEPSRDAVLERIATAVDRWDRRAERNINYRSFEPILTLLNVYHTPQCQLWAVWALANLTSVYPSKYCSLVKAEGGLRLLSALLRHPAPQFKIKQLAMIVINNCSFYSEPCPVQRADTPD